MSLVTESLGQSCDNGIVRNTTPSYRDSGRPNQNINIRNPELCNEEDLNDIDNDSCSESKFSNSNKQFGSITVNSKTKNNKRKSYEEINSNITRRLKQTKTEGKQDQCEAEDKG